MTMQTGDRVVVGVSGSRAGQAALRAAIDEARRRHVPLHLVRVWRELDWLPSATWAETAVLRETEHADRALLTAVTALARYLAPDLAITTEFTEGDVYEVLEARAADASLLVVGARADNDPGPIGRWLGKHVPAPVRVVAAEGQPAGLAR